MNDNDREPHDRLINDLRDVVNSDRDSRRADRRDQNRRDDNGERPDGHEDPNDRHPHRDSTGRR